MTGVWPALWYVFVMPDETSQVSEPAENQAITAETESAEEIRLSSAALRARMDRHHRATIKAQFGVDDPAALKAQLEELAALKIERQKAADAELTELEKHKRDLDAARQEHAKLLAQVERSAHENKVARECARLGIQDVEYASYAFERAHAADGALDLGEWLAAESKKRPGAFGIAATTAPVTTSPGTAPAPTPPKAGAPSEVDAVAMSPAEFMRRYGISPRR